MERTVQIEGRTMSVIVDEPSAPSGSASRGLSSSQSVAGAAATTTAAQSAIKKTSNKGAYHCSSCDSYFWDSAAIAAHRASRKHRENTGQIAREKILYKNDGDVTVQDILDLVERKRLERKDCHSLSEVVPREAKRCRETS